ncbi:hypothetical protein B0I35DRAFT_437454 [Stachybotrys elegans]|uniref:Uncharacterized protein n=1 Tax=Stachybotrys elegans TaxID=80388 RepID=A0A8K0WNM4_9HYPO|nr:hypothetical protein B0I35DRAFT_437454 [Stachybotrys elegans]
MGTRLLGLQASWARYVISAWACQTPGMVSSGQETISYLMSACWPPALSISAAILPHGLRARRLPRCTSSRPQEVPNPSRTFPSPSLAARCRHFAAEFGSEPLLQLIVWVY